MALAASIRTSMPSGSAQDVEHRGRRESTTSAARRPPAPGPAAVGAPAVSTGAARDSTTVTARIVICLSPSRIDVGADAAHQLGECVPVERRFARPRSHRHCTVGGQSIPRQQPRQLPFGDHSGTALTSATSPDLDADSASAQTTGHWRMRNAPLRPHDDRLRHPTRPRTSGVIRAGRAGHSSGRTVVVSGRTRSSWLREPMSSLVKTLCKWY